MAKTKKKQTLISFSIPTGAIVVESMADAIEALEEMDEIQALIEEAQRRTVDLKKAATEWAVDKQVDVIQLDGRYFRQIQRINRAWDNELVKKIVKGKKAAFDKPLWNFLTKRVVDPEKITIAVKKGYIKEKEIQKAYVSKPQAPFLQRFNGDAVDG